MADIYWFNSSNDLALASNNIRFTPHKIIQKLENDLSVLPFVFASENDIVLVDSIPDNAYYTRMQNMGFVLPIFISKSDFFDKKLYTQYSINAIKPWGWSKNVYTFFRDVLPLTSEAFKQSLRYQWNDKLRDLSCRTTAKDVLKDVLTKPNNYVSNVAIAGIITKIEEIDQLLVTNRQWVLKAPWSSSGRGILVINTNLFNAANKVWINHILKEQGFIMVEPWFSKKKDFSFLYAVVSNSIRLLCLSNFETGDKGQYLGSFIHWNNDEMKKYQTLSNQSLMIASQDVASVLMKHSFNTFYDGWLGVDAMIIEENEHVKIHPCIEINCRYTVGHVAYALQKYVHETSNAKICIGQKQDFYKRTLQFSNATSFINGLFYKGVEALTPITADTQFVAWIESV